MSLPKPALIIINKCVKCVFNCNKNTIIKRSVSSDYKMHENRVKLLMKELAPRLIKAKHKGQDGRIGVFGGSLEYTGAPYFAAISSLKVGADLSHVFCTKEAAPVIKSYSPELIVHPLLDASEAASKIEPWLDRLHVILIGPGLGREPSTFKVIEQVMELCRLRKKPLVIDADALFYVSQKPEILRDYPSPVLLTPNVMEFSRLVGSDGEGDRRDQSEEFLKLAENITILCKGPDDDIFNRRTRVAVGQGGSRRRCGGQGDLLAGAAATFLTWALRAVAESEAAVAAAYAACVLTRSCNERAFGKMGRSMTCSDMIREIHEAFDELFERK